MAFTTTISGGDATVTGTSSADLLTATTGVTGSFELTSQAGADSVTVSTAVDGGSIKMGGGVDRLTVTGSLTDISAVLGDSDDIFDGNTDDGLTVGGQSGDDTFTIDAVSDASRYAGGQGEDTFNVTAAITDYTVVGGSDDDTVELDAGADGGFVNGQVGEDTINIDAVVTNSTIRGGSEDDTIDATGFAATGNLYAGDNGADTIIDAGGANTLNGGGGADELTGGTGFDTLIGGEGTDTYTIAAGDAGSVDDAVTVEAAFTDGNVINVTEATSEFLIGYEAGEEIDTTTAAALNGTDIIAAGGALNDGFTYFATGTYSAGEFLVTEGAGDDAIIYIGGAAATGGNADAQTFDFILVQGGASALTAGDFA